MPSSTQSPGRAYPAGAGRVTHSLVMPGRVCTFRNPGNRALRPSHCSLCLGHQSSRRRGASCRGRRGDYPSERLFKEQPSEGALLPRASRQTLPDPGQPRCALAPAPASGAPVSPGTQAPAAWSRVLPPSRRTRSPPGRLLLLDRVSGRRPARAAPPGGGRIAARPAVSLWPRTCSHFKWAAGVREKEQFQRLSLKK